MLIRNILMLSITAVKARDIELVDILKCVKMIAVFKMCCCLSMLFGNNLIL